MRSTQNTIIDFYEGAYSPTIRIDVQTIEWLKLLKYWILQLKSNALQTLDLITLGDVDKDEIAEQNLILGSKSTAAHVSLKHSENLAFIWTISAEMIDIIDDFTVCNKAGHHYLNEDDKIIIELAYKE